MPELKCTVQTCAHNKNYYCALDKIVVGGDSARKHRIAKGAGVDIADVNRMVKSFNEMRKMMKQFGKMGKGKKGRFRMPF